MIMPVNMYYYVAVICFVFDAFCDVVKKDILAFDYITLFITFYHTFCQGIVVFISQNEKVINVK